MIDAELITRKILLVVRDLDALRPIAAKARDAYLSSGLDEAAAERYLARLIGRMIDVNYHLLTESGQPPPSDYHASFGRLADLGVLDRELALRIARCAGRRRIRQSPPPEPGRSHRRDSALWIEGARRCTSRVGYRRARSRPT